MCELIINYIGSLSSPPKHPDIMLKKKHSIKAIAKDLNISPTTVSFVLNGKATQNRISQRMIEKVLAHVDQIGYRPSQLAKSLRTGRSSIIAFMVEDISNPFFAYIAKSIEEKAFLEGYKVIYCSTNNDPDKTSNLVRMLSDLQVDGYIITPPERMNSKVVKELCDSGKPVILFDRYLPDVDCSHVVIDNFQATALGLDLLTAKGLKKTGFITLDSDQSQMQDRLAAYHHCCAVNGVERRILKIPFSSATSEVAGVLMQEFFMAHLDLEAVFFTTNYLAMTGIHMLKQLGIKIPDDLAVIAFDDNEFFKFNNPSITSIVQPKEEIADHVVKIMFEMLTAGHTTPNHQKVVLPAILIRRESTKIASTTFSENVEVPHDVLLPSHSPSLNPL